LCGTLGELEAARVVARLLGAVCEHGEDRVRLALEAAINQHRIDVLDLPVPGPKLERRGSRCSRRLRGRSRTRV